jgi:hypothetical protein
MDKNKCPFLEHPRYFLEKGEKTTYLTGML